MDVGQWLIASAGWHPYSHLESRTCTAVFMRQSTNNKHCYRGLHILGTHAWRSALISAVQFRSVPLFAGSSCHCTRADMVGLPLESKLIAPH